MNSLSASELENLKRELGPMGLLPMAVNGSNVNWDSYGTYGSPSQDNTWVLQDGNSLDPVRRILERYGFVVVSSSSVRIEMKKP